MTIHVLHVPTVEVSRTAQPARWCFHCRRRHTGSIVVHAPADRQSYYGPHASYECDGCHGDHRAFPGTWIEWGDES